MYYKDIEFTEHAAKRMQQRGIKKQMVMIILGYADKKIHVGNGSVSMSVSKQRLEVLKNTGDVSAQIADKISGICIVVTDDNGQNETGYTIVTVMHILDKKGRRYRKSYRRNYNRSWK